jgi:hypothetical protein
LKLVDNCQDNRKMLLEENLQQMTKIETLCNTWKMMLTTTRIQESCDSKINGWDMHVDFQEEGEQILNFVLKENEATSSHKNYASTKDEELLHEDMLKEVTTIGILNDKSCAKGKKNTEEEMERFWRSGWKKTQMMDIAWRLQIQFKMILLNCMRS